MFRLPMPFMAAFAISLCTFVLADTAQATSCVVGTATRVPATAGVDIRPGENHTVSVEPLNEVRLHYDRLVLRPPQEYEDMDGVVVALVYPVNPYANAAAMGGWRELAACNYVGAESLLGEVYEDKAGGLAWRRSSNQQSFANEEINVMSNRLAEVQLEVQRLTCQLHGAEDALEEYGITCSGDTLAYLIEHVKADVAADTQNVADLTTTYDNCVSSRNEWRCVRDLWRKNEAVYMLEVRQLMLAYYEAVQANGVDHADSVAARTAAVAKIESQSSGHGSVLSSGAGSWQYLNSSQQRTLIDQLDDMSYSPSDDEEEALEEQLRVATLELVNLNTGGTQVKAEQTQASHTSYDRKAAQLEDVVISVQAPIIPGSYKVAIKMVPQKMISDLLSDSVVSATTHERNFDLIRNQVGSTYYTHGKGSQMMINLAEATINVAGKQCAQENHYLGASTANNDTEWPARAATGVSDIVVTTFSSFEAPSFAGSQCRQDISPPTGVELQYVAPFLVSAWCNPVDGMWDRFSTDGCWKGFQQGNGVIWKQ